MQHVARTMSRTVIGIALAATFVLSALPSAAVVLGADGTAGEDPSAGTTTTTTTTPPTTTSTTPDPATTPAPATNEPPATEPTPAAPTTVSATDSTTTVPTPEPPTPAATTAAAGDFESHVDGAPGRTARASAAITAAVEKLVVVFLTPDPTNTISIDKTNTADGEPARDGGTVEPGESYTYNFLASCSNINLDCVNLTVVDTFPADVIVDVASLPASIPGFRTVNWAAGTRTLTVVYVEPLANPPGALGKRAGTSDSFTVSVTLPEDTTLVTDDVIPNQATISAGNVAQSATDPSNVIVNIPRIVGVSTTKAFSDQSAIAGDPDAVTTIELNADNLSSSSAEVTEMTIEDSTPDTFEYLDVTGITVTQYPAGADTATLFVCPEADAPCSETEWVSAGTGTAPGPSTLTTAPVPADEVVGVRVVFTAPAGGFIAPVADGGSAAIDIDMALRDTVRSTSQPIDGIPTTTTLDNVVTSTVDDPGADPATATDTDDAEFQILPPTLNLDPSKSFFADGDGNYQTDAGEHAVIGENSGVSMILNAQNTSAFPIAQITITEPVPPNEFDKFDATSLRLTFPAGAANAHVVVTYADASTTTNDYAPPGPTTVPLGTPPPRVTSITVTYTGADTDGDGQPDPTIEPQATAGVGIHGNLNELVDTSDVISAGVAAGIDNCAGFTGSGGGVPGTTGTFSGTECDQLPVEDRGADTDGSKTASQNQIPLDQPVRFRMTTTNNGNLPLFDLVVSDPPPNPDGTPPLTPVFEYGMFLDASVEPAAMADRVTIQVYTPAGDWQDLGDVDELDYPDVIGVRATMDVLNPTESFVLIVDMISRVPFPDPPPEPGTVITNCYSVDASGDDYVVEDPYCGPPISPTPVSESAVINKAITPQTMPRRIPGMTPQNATVNLQIRNSGDILASTLQLTDVDEDFWDAVDFVSLGSITAPQAFVDDADQIRIDAFVDGAWIIGDVTSIGDADLPAGVTSPSDQVRGLRFTFSDSSLTNDGYVLTPCVDPDPTVQLACTGLVEFQVVPRLTLLGTGDPLPDQLLDTASGAFTTRLHPNPDDPALIADVTDDLDFVPGDPQLDVDKTPDEATVQPGQISTFTLTTTNNGTANLPDVTVSDPLPDGILFDGSFADPDTGQPYTVTWSNLPDGYPAAPDAVFAATPDPTDPTRVGLVRWTFPGWDMPPNATVAIFFRYTLAPGVRAGDLIENTMGASSPVDEDVFGPLVCTPPDVVVTGTTEFGTGTYCTDPADVTVSAGANFASRKWVAGNPDLGWYNTATGLPVPIGGGGCLSLAANGRTYTTNPCIALVNPGEMFHYVLRVQNAGTEDALQMTIIDTFPAPGDTGVLGAARGTEWATAPTLTGPAVYNGPSNGEIGYTSGIACTDDLFLDDPPCPAGAWNGTWDASNTALRMAATFDPAPLPPGGTVDVYFSMTTPAVVPRVSDPTIAWNSIAHAEITEPAPGQERVLTPLEPLKVGVATMYGNLQVIKEIGRNPAFLPLANTAFEFAYECTMTNGMVGSAGTVTATRTTPGLVTAIASGSTCEVWETETHGGITDAPVSDPVEVVIQPSLDPATPVVSSVTVTNDFPFGALTILKTVAGDANADLTAGPYPVTADCTFDGTELRGFPLHFVLTPGVSRSGYLPVGSTCTITETDANGAAVTYDPPNQAGDAAQGTVPSDGGLTLSISVTNTFATGSLVIAKEVIGPGAPEFSDGPFFFGVSCTYGDATTAMVVVVPGSDDGTPVESEPVPGLPIGSTCTITEIGNGGADSTPPPQIVVIDDGETDVFFASFENPFSAGTIAVVKHVDGDAADSAHVQALAYTVAVECAVDVRGTLVPLVDQDIVIRGDGVPVTVLDSTGDPILLPLGTRCWGTETSSGGATSVVIDHDSYETGIEVVAAADGGLQPLAITVTNTFDPAILTVGKIVVNEPDTNAVYTFTVDCTITDADGTTIPSPLLAGTSPLTLGANESASFEVLVGSVCRVVETDSRGATTSIVEAGATPDTDTTDGTVTIDDERIVTVTNTFPSGVLPQSGTDLTRTGWILALVLLASGAVLLEASRQRRRQPVFDLSHRSRQS